MTGLLILFIWAFLSATILPIGVEPYFIQQVVAAQGWLLPVVVASVGNTLGSVTILGMGYWGNDFIHKKLSGASPALLSSSERWTKKYGYWLLLLSWIPFAGDMMVMIISLMKPPLFKSILLLGLGKILRFLVLSWITLSLI